MMDKQWDFCSIMGHVWWTGSDTYVVLWAFMMDRQWDFCSIMGMYDEEADFCSVSGMYDGNFCGGVQMYNLCYT